MNKRQRKKKAKDVLAEKLLVDWGIDPSLVDKVKVTFGGVRAYKIACRAAAKARRVLLTKEELR